MSPLVIFFVVLVVVLVAIGVYFIFNGGEEPSLGPTPGPTPGPQEEVDVGVYGRYVKLEHTIASDFTASGHDTEKHKNISFAELEVFDKDGNNLALNKTVTGSQFRGAGPGMHLVDGDFTNFAQTLSREETERDYMLVDIGLSEIKKIKITNQSADDKKIIGVKVVILDEDGTTVLTETPVITTTGETFTLTFPENTWS